MISYTACIGPLGKFCTDDVGDSDSDSDVKGTVRSHSASPTVLPTNVLLIGLFVFVLVAKGRR